jgi:hypothetical protein
MQHTLIQAADHIRAIHIQIEAIDAYKKNNIISPDQAKTLAMRRKIYTDLLAGAVAVYESIKTDAAIIYKKQTDDKINRAIRFLKDTRVISFEEFCAARKNVKTRYSVYMDFNKFHSI